MAHSSMDECTAILSKYCMDADCSMVCMTTTNKCVTISPLSPLTPSSTISTVVSTGLGDWTNSDTASEVIDEKSWNSVDSEEELTHAESDSNVAAPAARPSPTSYHSSAGMCRPMKGRERTTMGAVAFKTVLWAMGSPPAPPMPPKEGGRSIGLSELPPGAPITEPAPQFSEDSEDELVNPRGWQNVSRRLGAVFESSAFYGADSESSDSDDELINACCWQDLGGRLASVFASSASYAADSESGDSEDELVKARCWQDVGGRLSSVFASSASQDAECESVDSDDELINPRCWQSKPPSVISTDVSTGLGDWTNSDTVSELGDDEMVWDSVDSEEELTDGESDSNISAAGGQWISLSKIPCGAPIPVDSEEDWHLLGRRLALVCQDANFEPEDSEDGVINPSDWQNVGRRLACVFAWEKTAARMAAVLCQAARDSEEHEVSCPAAPAA